MSDSDLEWFEKDDDTLLKDVEEQVERRQECSQDKTEYIKGPSALDEYIRKHTIKAAAYSAGKPQTDVTMSFLKDLIQKPKLDIFLTAMDTNYDFFSNQIYSNDNQEKVMLYTNILASICRLRLPGFNKDILKSFASNDNLHLNYLLILAKLVSNQFKHMWESELENTSFIKDIDMLLFQSSKYCKDEIRPLLQKMSEVLRLTENPEIENKSIITQLKKTISEGLKDEKTTEDDLDIYPTLDELIGPNETSNSALECEDYLSYQLHVLKQDFLISLKEDVAVVKNRSTGRHPPENFEIYENVSIVLNEEFSKALRNEFLFVDILGSKRKKETNNAKMLEKHQENVSRLKTGALLCFTKSYDFDTLIMALVTNTSPKYLDKGYIGIEVVRQYNTCNIYNCELIMFESTAFFLPYHAIFNSLKDCSASDFFMRKYIIDEQFVDIKSPNYLYEIKEYKCGEKTFKPLDDEPPQNVFNLNDSQLQAFKMALKQEFALIHGPPGTGKTHLTVEIVKTLMENVETPLVLITYTNDSLDKFLVKISAHTDNIVRLGSQIKDESVKKYIIPNDVHYLEDKRLMTLYTNTVDKFKIAFETWHSKQGELNRPEDAYKEILSAQRQLAEVKRKLDTIKTIFEYNTVRRKSIIGLTTTCAAKGSLLFRLLENKVVIFEEAAEILETHTLPCLTPYTQHVIMIGDHHQLRPFAFYKRQMESQVIISLFEKLINKGMNPALLSIQYRMHLNIANLICGTFYNNLVNHISVTKYPSIRFMSKNLFFLDHNKNETRRKDGSYSNEYEAEEMVHLASHLILKSLYKTEDIRILSPYYKQVDLIKTKISKNPFLKTLQVSTVDSFQGLECNIILLSLVRSNNISQIGFLEQKNRVCVALSRAKHAMYIIGNLQLLSQCSSTWLQIQQKLLSHNAVGSKFPTL